MINRTAVRSNGSKLNKRIIYAIRHSCPQSKQPVSVSREVQQVPNSKQAQQLPSKPSAKRSPPFIVLLGTDGTGKTGALNVLTLRHPQLAITDWRQHSHELLASTSLDDPQGQTDRTVTEFSRLSGPLKGAFLTRVCRAMDLFVDHAHSRGATAIIDSFWYRFHVKNQLLQFTPTDIKLSCRGLKRPDKVVLLRANFGRLHERLQRPNEYEQYPTGIEKIERFQKDQENRLVTLLKEEMLPTREVPGHFSAQEIVSVLEEEAKL